MEEKQMFVLCGSTETSIEKPFVSIKGDRARDIMRDLWKKKIDELTEDDIEETGFDEHKAYIYTQDNTYIWEIFECSIS